MALSLALDANLVVGETKTDAGSRRTEPLNSEALQALKDHVKKPSEKLSKGSFANPAWARRRSETSRSNASDFAVGSSHSAKITTVGPPKFVCKYLKIWLLR